MFRGFFFVLKKLDMKRYCGLYVNLFVFGCFNKNKKKIWGCYGMVFFLGDSVISEILLNFINV